MLVGVAVTGFGCGQYLAETVESLMRQTDEDWRCVIVFDPTEQGSGIRERTRRDPRFILIESLPVNVCAARNRGFGAISGDLLVALDGDDLLEPTYISAMRQLLIRPQVSIAYSQTRYFGDIAGLKHELPYSKRLMAIRNPIVSAAMFRRRDFADVGGYDERLSIGYEDWELWIAILKRGGEVAFDSVPRFLYRQRPDSRSRRMSHAVQTEAKEYIFQKHQDFCWHSKR